MSNRDSSHHFRQTLLTHALTIYLYLQIYLPTHATKPPPSTSLPTLPRSRPDHFFRQETHSAASPSTRLRRIKPRCEPLRLLLV